MNKSISESLSGRLLQMLSGSAQRSSTLHHQFLQVRRNSLQDMRMIIAMQINAGMLEQGVDPETGCPPAGAPAIFTSQQLDEFGTGKISSCLGPAFSRYDGRRIPRIPNGDLKMMSRIVEIDGCPFTPGHPYASQPASITAAYDVPVDAWFFQDSASPEIPYSLLMEIALQPCGFLSAYLDSYALVPYDSFFFRNLDGTAQLLESVDLRGKTVTTRARMLSSVVSGGTVIQRFAFELSCAGRAFYVGESAFGYFSPETMANQMGLDGGQNIQPLLQADPSLSRSATRIDTARYRQADPGQPFWRLGSGRLQFLDEVFAVPGGGRYQKGYVYARRPVDPHDWFYPYHFYGDPVMPGSLGVEAVLEAMQAYAVAAGQVVPAAGRPASARFGPLVRPQPVTWRYRGQITRQNQGMELEVHLSETGPAALVGDASLWVDGLRIYEVKNVGVSILPVD